jgi:hypothetical protein
MSGLLVTRLVEEALEGTTAPVRSVNIEPLDDDRFDVVLHTTWPFVPPLRVVCAFERQPRFPESPELVVRWSLLGAFGTIVSRFIAALGRLPSGVRIEGDRLLVDVSEAAAARGHGDLMRHVSALELHTVKSQIVIDVALDVR